MPIRRSAGLVQAVIAGAALLPVASASANVGISSSFTVSPFSAVGQTGLSGSLTFANTNTSPNESESNTLTTLELALSCGTAGVAANACSVPDPGAFAVASPAVGAAGTACAGTPFSVSAPNASGVVTLTPGTQVVLAAPQGPPGSSSCTVNFTYSARRVPTTDTNAAAPSVQTRSNARVSATSSVTAVTATSAQSLEVTVIKGTPTLTNGATNATLGQPVHDDATVAGGGVGPTGTVTFNAYAPSDITCSGAPIFTSVNALSGSGVASSTNTFTPTTPGSYRWTASYSGDLNYNPLAPSACNAPGATSIVSAAPPPPPPPAPAPAPAPADPSAAATTGGGAAPGPGTASVPTGKFTLAGKPKLGKDGSVTFSLNVPGAGDINAAGTANIANASKLKKVCGGSTRASKASTISLKLRPNGTGKNQLRRKGKLKTAVKITFKPTAGGASTTVSQTVTLRLKR